MLMRFSGMKRRDRSRPSLHLSPHRAHPPPTQQGDDNKFSGSASGHNCQSLLGIKVPRGGPGLPNVLGIGFKVSVDPR
jgi:hypothetical protein